MSGAAYVDYGHFFLRQQVSRSGILDLWMGELRGDTRYLPCLVRRMLPPYCQSPDYLRLLEARQRELTGLEHPCALLPLETGAHDGFPFMLMEMPRGWNFAELLEYYQRGNRSFPLEVALRFFYQLSHLLATCHNRQPNPLVHGALRLQSLWLAADGTLKVGDLEVGALAEFELRGAEKEESGRFVAPERAARWASPGPSVDVYSVGALLLATLGVGRFTDLQSRLGPADQLAILYTQKLPAPLLKLVATCLRETPGERPDMTSLHSSLKALAAELPAPPPLKMYLELYAPPLSELAQLARGAKELRQLFQSLPPEHASEGMTEMATEVKVSPRDGNGAGKAVESLSEEGRGGGGRSSQPAASPPSTTLGASSQPVKHHRPAWMMPLLLGILVLALGAVGWVKLQPWLRGPGGAMVLVRVTSVPEGATILTLDGRELGVTPLKTPVKVDPDGRVGLSARKPGYNPAGPTFQEPGARSEVSFTFLLARAEGVQSLKVSTEPSGAKVQVDGKSVGTAPLEVPGLDVARSHHVSVSLAGYRSASKVVRLQAGQENSLRLKLERSRRGDEVAQVKASGQVVVRSQPPAQLLVDGKAKGVTGDRRLSLPVGAHRLELREPGSGRTTSWPVEIQEGGLELLEYDFASDRWSVKAREGAP